MPINLAELDLPDLDLSNDKPSNDDTAEGLAND
jgi:hypothetical protein